MQLTVKITQNLGAGHVPQVVHMMDGTLHVFYLTDGGEVDARSTVPALGQYDNLVWSEAGKMATDQGISCPSIKKIAHFGACGFWSADQDHRFVNYALPFDISPLLMDGNAQLGNDSPISQLSMTARNINSALMGKYRSSVTPGAKINLSFTMGGSESYPMGTFFADNVNGRREEAQISISGRNSIGKLLKEQTFDEAYSFTAGNLRENLIAILQFAGVEDYFVSDTSLTWNLTFDPATAILDGLQSVVQLITGWKIAENSDGTVGIGPANDSRFDQPATYTFHRDSTCWSCDVSQDDADSYARVCVRCKNPESTVYRTSDANPYWPIPSHKTLYVDVPDGTATDQIKSYADTLATTASIVGRVETFAGIFTPQLTVGDAAEVIEADGRSSVAGTITTVAHYFGRSGFYTQFTVDSGGRIGKPMLKDYINAISGQGASDSKVTIS